MHEAIQPDVSSSRGCQRPLEVKYCTHYWRCCRSPLASLSASTYIDIPHLLSILICRKKFSLTQSTITPNLATSHACSSYTIANYPSSTNQSSSALSQLLPIAPGGVTQSSLIIVLRYTFQAFCADVTNAAVRARSKRFKLVVSNAGSLL